MNINTVDGCEKSVPTLKLWETMVCWYLRWEIEPFQCILAWCRISSINSMGQNQWYHFGAGAPLILVYFNADWDVHWGYGILTHGHMATHDVEGQFRLVEHSWVPWTNQFGCSYFHVPVRVTREACNRCRLPLRLSLGWAIENQWQDPTRFQPTSCFFFFKATPCLVA